MTASNKNYFLILYATYVVHFARKPTEFYLLAYKFYGFYKQ